MLAILLSNWRLLGLGILLLLLGIQTWRVDSCKKARHEAEVSYEAKIVTLQGSLQAQNEAVAKLGKESADRRAKAQKALQAAQEGVQKARSEAQRLRDLAKAGNAPSDPTACPAGDALNEVRKGLTRTHPG